MPEFDLNRFLGDPPAGQAAAASRGELAAHLQYIEDDIPDAAFQRLEDFLATPAGASLDYLSGLCHLHRNEHPLALAAFERSILAWPRATNPRAHYVIATLESPPVRESETAYKRDFYLRTLAEGLPMPYSKHLAGLTEAMESVLAGELFTATARLDELDAEIPAGQYLTDLLLIKCLAGLGRSQMTVAAVARRRDPLLARYPRLQELGGGVYPFFAG